MGTGPIPNPPLALEKLDVIAILYETADLMSVTVAVAYASDGAPVTGLQKENFRITATAGPFGWAASVPLKIGSFHGSSASGQTDLPNGVYAFSLSQEGQTPEIGPWILFVEVNGFEQVRRLRGQTIVKR